MPSVRPRDVVQEIDKLYTLPAGPGTIPLDQTTIPSIRKILKLVQRIPNELLSKAPNRQLLDDSIRLLRQRVQEAEGNPSSVPLLHGIPEHQWENPLSIMKRMLGWTPNFRPKEFRRRLLEQADEYLKLHPGSVFSDFTAMSLLGTTDLDEIRRHMKILSDQGFGTMTEQMDGSCSLRLTPKGWKFLEESENQEEKGLLFISCGQFTEEERALGRGLSEAIEELTPFTGYFAQNQSSLDGLSKHIFGALNQAAGLVAVMRHRGLVKTPYGEHLRASVWVEQEIAIAAFLTQTLGRDLPVILYLQQGIALEGVRQQLMLNPVYFKENAEVVRDFRQRLSSGLFQATASAAGSL